MIQSQQNISGLKVVDHITYQCEIGNLGCHTSEIRKIIMDDDTPLKLDNWGCVGVPQFTHSEVQNLGKWQIRGQPYIRGLEGGGRVIITPGNQVKHRDYQGCIRDFVMGLVIGPESGHCQIT